MLVFCLLRRLLLAHCGGVAESGVISAASECTHPSHRIRGRQTHVASQVSRRRLQGKTPPHTRCGRTQSSKSSTPASVQRVAQSIIGQGPVVASLGSAAVCVGCVLPLRLDRYALSSRGSVDARLSFRSWRLSYADAQRVIDAASPTHVGHGKCMLYPHAPSLTS